MCGKRGGGEDNKSHYRLIPRGVLSSAAGGERLESGLKLRDKIHEVECHQKYYSLTESFMTFH